MSGIDEVIARARQPGGFSERKQFRIARDRAIGKLRRFALADPHEYILELIQSGIANGATSIQVDISATHCTFAYVGGGLRSEDLARLFDFLFASKDRAETGSLRELALGVNAVMLFEPDCVVIESGDGTLAGSSRLLLRDGGNDVQIGRPDRPLFGTFVSIQGIQRGKLPKALAKWMALDVPPEIRVIEGRCLLAPIPIFINDEALFGVSRQRIPNLIGYTDRVEIDEGDLYGVIGRKRHSDSAEFRLLTWGVAIQSKQQVLIPHQPIGGILCFDRLRKTVDHSGIVEDERLRELWVRVHPYAVQIATGRSASTVYAATTLAGEPLDTHELRQLARNVPRVVLVPLHTARAPGPRARALAISRAIDAPVVCGSAEIVPSLRALSGDALRVLVADVSDDRMASFLSRPQAPLPSRPWITPPSEVPPLAIALLAARLSGAAPGGERADGPPPDPALVAALGGATAATATVFTPGGEREATHDDLLVSVRIHGRIAWEGPIASSHPGHVLVVELEDGDPNLVAGTSSSTADVVPLGERIAHVMASHATSTLAEVARRSLDALASERVTPGSAAAALGLAAAVRAVVPRLTPRAGSAAVEFVQLEHAEIDLVHMPLLRTLDDHPVDLATLAAWMGECHGLVYGVVDGVPARLEGLRRDRLLRLSPAEERWLVALVGESSFVRIDDRDVLAEHEGLLCRDLALGLRDATAFPLLIEDARAVDGVPRGDRDPNTWSVERRTLAVGTMLSQLTTRLLGVDPCPPADARAHGDWEECRRHALRHLQWFACHLDDLDDALPHGHWGAALAAIPLFLDDAGRARTWPAVRAALRAPGGLSVHYGHGGATADLGPLAAAALREGAVDDNAPIASILAPPFVYGLLAARGVVRTDLSDLLARLRAAGERSPQRSDGLVGDPHLLVSVPVEGSGIEGMIGVAALGSTPHQIIAFLPTRERVAAFSDLAQEFGCVGWLRLTADVDWDEAKIDALSGMIHTHCERALGQMVERIRVEQDPQCVSHMLEALLHYFGRHVTLTASAGEPLRVTLGTPLAETLATMPLFASADGNAMPAWMVFRRYAGLFAEDPALALTRLRSELAADLDPAAARWLEQTLAPANVVRQRPAQSATARCFADPTQALSHAALAHTLTVWLSELSPDVSQIVRTVRIEPEEAGSQMSFPPDLGVVRRTEVGRPTAKTASIGFDPEFGVVIPENHWLVRWAHVEGARDPGVLAWLLLSIYAQINARLGEVTLEHERTFQTRVAQSLANGELRALVPRARHRAMVHA